MRIRFIAIFFFISVCSFAQQAGILKITTEICDSLSKIEKPLEELTKQESNDLIVSVVIKNKSVWSKEFNEYKIKSGTGEAAYFYFFEYFQHILQMDCKDSRIINNKLDNYLSDKENLRVLYFITKDFVIGLEDKLNDEELEKHLSDKLIIRNADSILSKCKIEIDKYKRTSILSIMLVDENTYTFRVRYSDYLTQETVFQIDVVFNNLSESKISDLTIKDKPQLTIELMERIKFNKAVENGEIVLPPPPPTQLITPIKK